MKKQISRLDQPGKRKSAAYIFCTDVYIDIRPTMCRLGVRRNDPDGESHLNQLLPTVLWNNITFIQCLQVDATELNRFPVLRDRY